MYAVQPPRHQPNEPKWQEYQRYGSAELPASTRLWLLDKGSLTQRLVAASGGDFRVVVLSQGWQRPSLSESILLDMPHRQLAIVREVILMCHDQAVVCARSVMPATSLTGRLRHLRHFDNRSLGELLFRDKSMRRQEFELTRINGDSEKIPREHHQKGRLWGRRSRFELAKKPIMVSEIFLNHYQVDK